MKLRTLLAVAVAGAFALPFSAQASADGDRMILAQAGGPAGASSVGRGPTGGTPNPQSAGEPATQRDRAAGGPVNSDLSRCQGMVGTERDTCMRDANRGVTGSATGGAATGGATAAPGVASTPSAPSATGTTAGPGEASNRTAPSSDTATSPSTSGTGKAK
jgi:hypothetical protein